MHRNCIFCLTLIRDSLFFYCKSRLVQTNITKLLLTKHNFPLVFYFQKGILFSITASTQFTPLVSFYCAGLRRMKQKISLLKTTTTICFPNFLTSFLNSTQNALLCQTSEWIWRPAWWTVQQPLTHNGFVSVYRWQRGLYLASSGSKSCACVSAQHPCMGTHFLL